MSIFMKAAYQLTMYDVSQFVEPCRLHLNSEGLIRDWPSTVLDFCFTNYSYSFCHKSATMHNAERRHL